MWRAWMICLAHAAGLLCVGAAQADDTLAVALRQRHAELSPALARSEFGRPLLLESVHGRYTAEGLVHAVLPVSMAQMQALAEPQRWCEVLMLHQVTQHCAVGPGGREIEVTVSSRPDSEGYALRLRFESEHQRPELLSVRLSAQRGPLGSRDYEISLQATPLPSGAIFMRFRYSYSFGLLARFAVQGYLNTWGQKKIGFSRSAGAAGEPPQPVTGMRGVIERNTMRYFLAIEAVLRTLEPGPASWLRRLELWFDATEQYPAQLHEMERQDYLALKRRQLRLP
jgi:hypothetical protein